MIESTNLESLTREMTAEFYALKGMLLAQIGKVFSIYIPAFDKYKKITLNTAYFSGLHKLNFIYFLVYMCL